MEQSFRNNLESQMDKFVHFVYGLTRKFPNPNKRFYSSSIMNILFFLIYIFLTPFLVFSQTTPTAYLSSATTNYAPGSEFQVSVLLDSTNLINTTNFEISYDSKSLEFLGFDTSGSIIDAWQNSPSFTTPSLIAIKGGIFNSFSGRAGLIVKLNFKSLKNGETSLIFKKAEVYLADGKGTKIVLIPNSYKISIDTKSDIAKIPVNPDLTPPEVEIEIIKEPISGEKLLAYRTYDSESGINYSIVRFKNWFTWSNWISVPNPVLVPKGIWGAEFQVVNNNGVLSKEFIVFKAELVKKTIILLGIIALAIILILFYNKLRIKKWA